jgi:hypothetical protein
MTAGNFPEPVVRKRAVWTLDKATRDVGLVMLGCFAGLMGNRGRAITDWFYAFAMVAILAISFALTGAPIIVATPSHPPMPRPRAIGAAALSFLVSAAAMSVFMVLMTDEKKQLLTGIIVGVMSGITTFRARRGKPQSRWPSAVIVGTVLLLLVIVLLLKRSHLGPFHR